MKKLTLCSLAIVTGILTAGPVLIPSPNPVPVSKPDPLATARNAVQTTIIARLQPSFPTFSRALPMPVLPSYQVVERVEGEERMPFTVSIQRPASLLSGYVRLSDNAIFIFRPETNDYIPSNLDPRFAPPKEIRIEPVKPT